MGVSIKLNKTAAVIFNGVHAGIYMNQDFSTNKFLAQGK
jgi:hypothetical protein